MKQKLNATEKLTKPFDSTYKVVTVFTFLVTLIANINFFHKFI